MTTSWLDRRDGQVAAAVPVIQVALQRLWVRVNVGLNVASSAEA